MLPCFDQEARIAIAPAPHLEFHAHLIVQRDITAGLVEISVGRDVAFHAIEGMLLGAGDYLGHIHGARDDGRTKQLPCADRFASGVFGNPMMIACIANLPADDADAVAFCLIGQR